MSWIERITRWLRQPRMQAAHGGPAGRRPAHGHGASSRRPQELCRSDGTPVLSGHFSDDELGRALYMAQHRLGVDLRGIELKNRRVTLSAIGARPIRLDMPGADLSGGWLMGGGTRLLAVSGDFSGTRLGNLRGLRFEESRLDRIVLCAPQPLDMKPDLAARDTRLRGADLREAARLDLARCDLAGARIGTGLDLYGSRLETCSGLDELILCDADGKPMDAEAMTLDGPRRLWRQGDELHLLDGVGTRLEVADREGALLFAGSGRSRHLAYLLHVAQQVDGRALPRADLRGTELNLDGILDLGMAGETDRDAPADTPVRLDLPGVDLTGGRIDHSRRETVALTGDFSQGRLTEIGRVRFVRANLDGIDYRPGARFAAAPFIAEDSSLRGVDLRPLARAQLTRCDLAGAIIGRDQRLTDFDFTGSRNLDRVVIHDSEDRPIPGARLTARGEIHYRDGSIQLRDGTVFRAQPGLAGQAGPEGKPTPGEAPGGIRPGPEPPR